MYKKYRLDEIGRLENDRPDVKKHVGHEMGKHKKIADHIIIFKVCMELCETIKNKHFACLSYSCCSLELTGHRLISIIIVRVDGKTGELSIDAWLV